MFTCNTISSWVYLILYHGWLVNFKSFFVLLELWGVYKNMLFVIICTSLFLDFKNECGR